MQKIDGVESVAVSLNQGNAKVQLKPGNRVHLQQLRTAVTDQGFTPQEAKVVAVGDLVSSNGKLRFKIRGTSDVLDVLPTSPAKWQPGTNLLVTGVIARPEGKGADIIDITAAQAAAISNAP